uniref:Rhoptry neck protein RON6 n=1 Tax=Toxoplasma gondii COUG TaxID=1074873 RepID=A0A2G8XVQ1_TOXGO|nr:rhoptry neck protein RON6 [Toxoplasma gondii COUG]
MRPKAVQQMLTTVETSRRKASTSVRLVKGVMRQKAVQQMLTTVETSRKKEGKQGSGGESSSSQAGHAKTEERKSGYSHHGPETEEDTAFSHSGGGTGDERETRRSNSEQRKERTEEGGARDQPQNEKKTEEQHAQKQEEQYKRDIALSKHQEAEENRRHADVLLQHHHLGQGGPRGRTAVTSHSHMHVQDVTQHHQLQEATQMAGKLTRHLQIQNSLKLREMFLKRKEVGHLNLLKHFQDLMQAVVSRIYSKLKGAKRSLKRMYSHSRSIIKRFLHETDHKVVRPEELPSAVLTPPDEGNVLGKTTNGIVMDCPTDCNPAACDNKPVEPAQCFVSLLFCTSTCPCFEELKIWKESELCGIPTCHAWEALTN